jgi:hypothetical protein
MDGCLPNSNCYCICEMDSAFAHVGVSVYSVVKIPLRDISAGLTKWTECFLIP